MFPVEHFYKIYSRWVGLWLAGAWLMGVGWAENTNTRHEQALHEALANGISIGIPGISVALGDGDAIVWTGTAGWSDLHSQRPVGPHDLFGIGSITKSFVAAIILQLAEEGEIDLHQPVTAYLKQPIVSKIPNAPTAPLRTLLNHQSGIPTWEFDSEWIRKGRGDHMTLNHLWGKTETLPYVAREDSQPDFEPETRYAYSNTNYTLLGLVIEAVTGNTLSAEIRRRFLDPLGMDHTYLDSFEPRREGFVRHYHYATPAFKERAGIHDAFVNVAPHLIETSPANLSPEWAAGGLVSSASDLTRWAQALHSGNVIGPSIRDALQAYTAPKEGGRPGFAYMQGLCRIENYGESGRVLIGHSGGTLGFTCMMYWIEGTDHTIVCLTNAGTMHTELQLSPPDAFFSKVLLPAALRYFEE